MLHQTSALWLKRTALDLPTVTPAITAPIAAAPDSTASPLTLSTCTINAAASPGPSVNAKAAHGNGWARASAPTRPGLVTSVTWPFQASHSCVTGW